MKTKFLPLKQFLSGDYFRTTVLFIFLLELMSFYAYLLPEFNKFVFFGILLVTLFLAIEKIEYGLYVVLAELFIGSKGYLFYLDFEGINISIRLGLFLVVFAAWFVKTIQNKKFDFFKSSYFYYYLGLIAIIGGGVLNGLAKYNNFDNIFFDFNGFLYLGLAPLFFDVIKDTKSIKTCFQVMSASLLATFVKITVLMFIFSHNINFITPYVYRWVRDTGVGEITAMDGNFYRIFFQAQIYTVIGFFILFAILVFRDKIFKAIWENKGFSLFVIALMVSILISFSRSFWFAIILTFGLLFVLLLFKYKYRFKHFLAVCLCLVIFLIISTGFIAAVVKFPYPNADAMFSAGMMQDRLKAITGEAGVSSRWNLLPELIDGIKQNPFIGSGFGSTITYKTEDPRVLTMNPTGMYTTYAFEWGYLDTIYKVGIIGFLVYLILLFKIWIDGWRVAKKLKKKINQRNLVIGMILAFVVLSVTHAFSPYLNHPLGIGYLLLCSSVFEYYNNKSEK